MSIEIKITDPLGCSKVEMRAMAQFLLACANVGTGHQAVEVMSGAAVAGAIAANIAADDAPDVGAPTAQEVFTKPAPGAVPFSVDAGTSEIVHEGPSNISAIAAFGSGPTNTSHIIPPAPPQSAALPVPPAPPAVPPTPSPAPAGVMLDGDGLPWDARIHSSSKETVTSGKWKAKRSVPPELVAAVTAELRALMAIPTPPPPPAPAVIPLIPSANHVPAPPAGYPVPPPPPVITPVQLFGKISSAVTAGTISPAQVQALLDGFGIQALPGIISARPDMAPLIDAGFDAMLAAAA